MTEHSTPQRAHPRRAGTAHPPAWRSPIVVVSLITAVTVYLFVTAPPPLAASPAPGRTVPIRVVFSILAAANDAARAVWTEDIVHHGTANGLAFEERWRDETVHAGPLPALFLRETAKHLERSPVRMRLFLGSPFPINAANQFSGPQTERFATLAASGAPQFFFEASTRLHTAMFPDRAIVEACVRCHNEHPDSPKVDWRLGEIMGATTWMYPEDAVTVDRALELVAALRASIRDAYAGYLTKVASFPSRPEIGERWPSQGFYLPSEDVFMRELDRRISPAALRALLDPEAVEVVVAAPAAPPQVAAPVAPAAGADERGQPVLVIRSRRSVKITVDREDSRLMVTRLSPGGSTSLGARPPLRLRLSERVGVEVEYGGTRIELTDAPPPAGGAGGVELELPAVPERS